MARLSWDGKQIIAAGLAILACLLLLPHTAAAQKAASAAVPQLFATSDKCMACHNGLVTQAGQDVSIGFSWQSSMMAHSAKDPYWQASVRRETLAHPDAAKSIEDECSACHMPMARYQDRANGGKGQVFAHLPVLQARTPMGAIAAEGVSCSMCHQIQSEKLGTEESFTAGFVVDEQTPAGKRPIFGPYEIDAGRKQIMQSAARFKPQQGRHVQDSSLCGSCHTLYTHTRGPDGEVIGTLPEQVPYLEWRHSDYYETQSCQSCHMPQLEKQMAITSVVGQQRENFSRHVFRGGNFFMLKIFNQHRAELGVTALPQDLDRASQQTSRNLTSDSARLAIDRAELSGGRLEAEVKLTNLAGHKLPTAYPSRRAWLHLTVKDRKGQTVFESGALNPDGSVAGNINDADRTRYEPHYNVIDDESQVQVYEVIMVDPKDRVTTGLLEAIRFVKDNRILPRGFDKDSAHSDIAVEGAAHEDPDFTGGTDTVNYVIPVSPGDGPFRIQAKIWYQPIGFRWAQNLKQQQAAEIDRFVSYFNTNSEQSGIVMAKDMKSVHK
ncbi:MAG: hypothetical protein ACQERN_06770 [Thermodesulfobacteriota bacterium]